MNTLQSIYLCVSRYIDILSSYYYNMKRVWKEIGIILNNIYKNENELSSVFIYQGLYPHRYAWSSIFSLSSLGRAEIRERLQERIESQKDRKQIANGQNSFATLFNPFLIFLRSHPFSIWFLSFLRSHPYLSICYPFSVFSSGVWTCLLSRPYCTMRFDILASVESFSATRVRLKCSCCIFRIFT